MSLDSMFEQFKEFGELKEFAESQHATIVQLSKKNTKLEEEVAHLKSLLGSTVPIIGKTEATLSQFGDTKDDKIIAEVQLARLKAVSFDRELTLEETKKVSEFSKIINNVKPKETKEVQSQTFSSEDLLKLAENI